MLRLLLNVIIIFLVVQTARSLIRGGKRAFQKSFGGQRRPTSDPKRQAGPERPYSEITPYDIEDADYEEIRD